MARPIVPLLIALSAGILVGTMIPVPEQALQLFLILTLSSTLISLWLRRYGLFYLSILISFYTLGSLQIGLLERPNLPSDHVLFRINESILTGEGIILECRRYESNEVKLIVSVRRILSNGTYHQTSGRLLLSVRNSPGWEYGDLIRFRTKLRMPRNFENPGGFDYVKYLRHQGILATGFINDPSRIILLRKTQGSILRTGLEDIRNRIRKVLWERIPDPEGRIIQAMILGERWSIPVDILEIFNKTGTTHIIAISGLHVGIVAFIGIFSIRRICSCSEYLLLRWNVEKCSSAVSMLLVLFYMAIAGAGISVVRATMMVLTFMIALLFNRERDLYHSLALAAFIILLFTPQSLFDISFQLSFSAVFFILFLAPRLISILKTCYIFNKSERESILGQSLFRRGLCWIAIFCIVSLSATLGTLPLILYYFNRLSFVTLIANLVVVPILGMIATPMFLLLILTIPLSDSLTNAVLYLSKLLVKLSLIILEHLSAVQYSSIFITTPSLIEIVLYYLFILSIGFSLNHKLRFAGDPTILIRNNRFWCLTSLALGVVLLCHALFVSFQPFCSSNLSLTALDVGQGSATLIRFPGGKRMLVDGGGFYDDQFDIGRNVIAPFLWKNRIDRIEIMVLTHPHPDHLQGLLFVLSHFNVHELWTNGDRSTSDLYEKFRRIAAEKKLMPKIVNAQTVPKDINGVKVFFLNPLYPSPPHPLLNSSATVQPPDDFCISGRTFNWRSDPTNDRSLVIKLTHGRNSFLLPSDITCGVEKLLIDLEKDVKSDVLFVPHHGSRLSSSSLFLDRVRPKIGVISCGKDNPHRFPHPDVLERLSRINAKIYRTDLNGAVIIASDGRTLRISTHANGGKSFIPSHP